jgi:hypothetical protein
MAAKHGVSQEPKASLSARLKVLGFDLGKALATILGIPIYYAGYFVYCLLYPIICVLYPFKMMIVLIQIIVMLIPNLILAIVTFINGLAGQIISTILGFVIYCGVLLVTADFILDIRALEMIISNGPLLLIAFAVLCVVSVVSAGAVAVLMKILDVFFSPLYFVLHFNLGFMAGAQRSFKYWLAAATLSFVVGGEAALVARR